MRDSGALSKEEGLALAIAIAAHVALIAALTMSPLGKTVQPPPERMTVTFSDEIADQSTSPDPAAQSAPDVAPELGEAQPEPAPPQPVVTPQPAPPQPAPAPPNPMPPRPAPPPPPKPQPRVQPAPQPRPQSQPQPRPQPQAQARPAPAPARPQPAPAKPVAQPQRSASAAARPADERLRRRPDAPIGGSRIGNDFLSGVPGSQNPGTAKTQAAATLGPEVKASLGSAIARQLKPHWAAPQGVDADKLVTILAWDLNDDGTLVGRPRVVQQLGITDANRPQASRHAEQAIRAVQLAAPFQLPNQYYNGWKRVAAFRFDRKLSQ